MPPKSKVQTPQRKQPATRLKEPLHASEREEFYCCRCGRKFKSQNGNFSVSQSQLFKGNSGYLPICKTCVDNMYDHYKTVLGDPKEAVRRVCMKLDIYWDDAIYRAVESSSTSGSRIRSYIRNSNLSQFSGSTYDDTLDMESGMMPDPSIDAATMVDESSKGYIKVATADDVPEEMVRFWGSGYTPDVYEDLDRRFNRWTTGNVSYAHDDPAQESILKQLCILERRIENGGMTGAKISDDINSYNSLMGSANLKPSQKKADAQSSDGTPFGVWIQRWENEQPIPEPDPDFADADGIVRYISIWFLGHLCKTLKIKNSYSRMYEEEIERLRVERPEYAGEDDEEFFQDVFDTGGG